MKAVFQQWISERALQPGMLGCAMAGPGGDGFCQCVDEAVCPPDKLAEILNLLEGLQARTAADGLEPRWRTWFFAGGKIRSVTRQDGWSLVAVVRADSPAAKNLDPLFAEFFTLSPGN